MTNSEQQFAEDELVISLNDIIDFFMSNWKWLFIGAISGFLIAFSGTLLLGKYQAEAALANRSGIDYFVWKDLRRNLPVLAAEISESTKDDESFLANALSDEKWWQKNVTPTFAIAKEDSKEIFGMPKEIQEAQSAAIRDFVFTVTGSSEEDALKSLSTATSFFRSGAAYLRLDAVITGYQSALLNSEPKNAQRISESAIGLAYLKDRIASLELLRARFPGNAGAMINQPMDPKDSSAKFLPIVTQLIAVNRDVDALNEQLSRLNDEKTQLAIMSSFLSQAKPVMDKSFDGLAAIEELMRIEASLRKDLRPADLNKIAKLDDIKSDLVSIHTSFTLGLEQPKAITTRKPGYYLKYAAIGLLGGFFLALLGSFVSAIWLRYRKSK